MGARDVHDRAGGEYTRTGSFETCFALAVRCVFAGDNDCACSITEESAGDDVGHGMVVLLPVERAEFDGEQESVLVRIGADVVDGAGDSGNSGGAAEAEDGRALDVAREAHAIDEACVDAGAGDAGMRVEEDSGDVGWLEAGIPERDADGLFPELDCMFDPEIVVRTKAGQGAEFFKREADVAEVDATVGVKAIHDVWE